MEALSLGIDIGASKIALGLVTDQGEVILRSEIGTKGKTEDKLLTDLEQAIHGLEHGSEKTIRIVGIGSVGPIDIEAGTISPVNIEIWKNFPIVDFIRRLLGNEEVTLIGDATALAYSEYRFGAALGSKNILGMVVSTGIGGGLIIDGKIYNGSTFNAGFIGHTYWSNSEEICACGRKGCLEAISSGPSMTRWFLEKDHSFQRGIGFQEVAQAAREGNEFALTAIRRGTKALAVTIANAAILLDLDCVVIGGGVTESGSIFWEPLQSAFESEIEFTQFSKVKKLHKSSLNRNAGVLGAASYAFDHFAMQST